MERVEIALASALQMAWGIAGRDAFDLSVAMAEAKLESEKPYDARFALASKTFPGRESTLRKKRKRGDAPLDDAALMALALQCRDLATAVRLFRSLLVLAETRGVKTMSQAVRKMLRP